MQDAKATIRASGYTLVFVYNAGGEIKTDVRDKAKIMDIHDR
jgi:hypothetical protein